MLIVAFSSSWSQFYTKRTDPKPTNNMVIFFPPVIWFCSRFSTNEFVYTALLSNQVARSTNDLFKKISSQPTSNSETKQGKMY